MLVQLVETLMALRCLKERGNRLGRKVMSHLCLDKMRNEVIELSDTENVSTIRTDKNEVIQA
jgi:hypothetical protein